MSRLIDLTGKKYGKLTVIQRAPNKNKRTAWLCQCDCGNTKVVSGHELKAGKTKSCGCLYSKSLYDLSGEKIGRWSVLHRAENKNGNVQYSCVCDCGVQKIVSYATLSKGKSKSCGCLQKELASKRLTHDLTGLKFGKLMVLEKAGRTKAKSKHILWKCQCECGNIATVRASALTTGNTTSCGCYATQRRIEVNTKYNKRYDRLYNIWAKIKERCNNPNVKSYQNYGARGITICEDWENSFVAFMNWAYDNNYSEELTIDRIDNTKGYSPDNCRWATYKQQANNKTNNHLIEYDGIIKTISEWSDITGIKSGTILYRIKAGWDIDRLFIPPTRKIAPRNVA